MPDTKAPSQSKTVSHLGHSLTILVKMGVVPRIFHRSQISPRRTTGNETTSTRARNKQSRNDAFLGKDHGVVRDDGQFFFAGRLRSVIVGNFEASACLHMMYPITRSPNNPERCN